MTPLTFIALSLAAYRAARAVAIDSITAPLRERADYWRWKWAQQLITCGYCVSFWLAGVTYLVWLLATDTWRDVGIWEHGVWWWAVAGAANMLIAIDTFLLREAPPK